MANQDEFGLVMFNMKESPAASVVRMVADIIGLNLVLKHPDVLNLEHKSKEYIKKNPMGTIPTLIDRDFIISDSAATSKYLLAKYGGNLYEKFYPSDIKTQALVDQCLFFNAGVIFVKMREVVLPTIQEGLKGPTAKNIVDIEDGYSVLEAYLADHKYLACDHITLADITVGATTNVLQGMHKLDQTKFPRTCQWLATINEEPYFKKIGVPAALELTGLMEYFWEKNSSQQ